MSTADPGLHYFALLSREEQRAAIHKLADAGVSDYTIGAATRLSVEMIRIILGERKAEQAK